MIDTNDHKAFGRSIARDRLYFWGGVLGIIGRRNIAFGLLFLYRFGRNFHMGWMVLTRACYYSALNVKRSFLNAQSGFYAWQFHSGFSYRPIACHVYVGSDLSTYLA